ANHVRRAVKVSTKHAVLVTLDGFPSLVSEELVERTLAAPESIVNRPIRERQYVHLRQVESKSGRGHGSLRRIVAAWRRSWRSGHRFHSEPVPRIQRPLVAS